MRDRSDSPPDVGALALKLRIEHVAELGRLSPGCDRSWLGTVTSRAYSL